MVSLFAPTVALLLCTASSVLAAPTKYQYSQLDLVSVPAHVRRDLTWSLQMGYSGQTFFDGFDFFTEPDPSHGSVTYVNKSQAFGEGLAFWTADGIPGIQAEHWTTTNVGDPRNSVRITSKALYAGGLFIFDVELMPWGCGVWPAIWTLGYEGTWPTTGEIDIVEGVQDMTANQMTVHTTPGCTIAQNTSLYTGGMISSDCDSSTGGAGCSIVSDTNNTFGPSFNDNGGGVYAMLWDGDGVRIWNFLRANVPSDITSGVPTPLNWGLPAAAFDRTLCDPYTFFQSQVLILNVNLCGDWAGTTYGNYAYCPGTCAEQITNPANLVNTVMLINSIKIYQQSGFEAIVGEAMTNSNQTGAAGAVALNTTKSNSTSTASSASASKTSGSAKSSTRGVARVSDILVLAYATVAAVMVSMLL